MNEMIELIKDFWEKKAKSPLYWIPIFIFSILSYGFSICNRTMHGDDLMKDYYLENVPLSSRWGMNVWSYLVGVTDYYPFVDRFVSLLFLLAASYLISVLFFFLKGNRGEVLSFTVLSSMVLTYPLINEIYEYTWADIQWTGNLVLAVLTFIYLTLRRSKPTLGVITTATLLMILPASSYEVAIFSYISLLCAVILYRHIQKSHYVLSLSQWFYENVYYLIPLILAIFFRFLVHYLLLVLYNRPSLQIGATAIDYSNVSFEMTIGANFFKYFIAGLVYFPISVFVFFSIVFFIYILRKSYTERSMCIILLGGLLYISVFALPILQVSCMIYRTAQTLTIFVAFCAYLLCEIDIRRLRLLISIILLFLCWHQAVYLNKILSLNNMRSNNEMACLHFLGNRLISEYGNRKPIIFVAQKDGYGGYLGPWIEHRLYADVDSWNGRIFDWIVEKFLPDVYHRYKFVNSNVNNPLNWYDNKIRDFFAYYGYNVNVVSYASMLDSVKDISKRELIRRDCETALREMNQLEIRDLGDFLIIKYY